ncbi:MAG: sigma-54-dependent transcriptional regulator, partial [Pseudobdellovibrionaceae bacterium]
AFDGINALEKLKSVHPTKEKIDVVILDVDMPRLNGLETLKQIKEIDPGIICLIVTAHATLDHAVQAVKDGAYNYISKPVATDDLLQLIDRAVKAHTLISSIAASSPVMMDAGKKIIGNTSQMQKVFNIIHRLAKVDTPVLIRGSSGTGKELVAKAIHLNSARKDEKFVAINCSAIPENLFESELFGHEKGSFTGAEQRKIGKFQFAEGGTLFLDEVGDMPQLMQVKILRVLQEKLFTPVGANREIQTNVRIIAATNRPLEEMIKTNAFREDLFYRLNVVPIFLPSLNERIEDVDQMVNNFIRKFNVQHSKKITGVSRDALKVLKKHTWPGNIRELENVIEHAFVLESTNVIGLASLPESLLVSTGVSLIDIERIHAGEKVVGLNDQAEANLDSTSRPSVKKQFSDSDTDDVSDLSSDDHLSAGDHEDDGDEIAIPPNSENPLLDFNAQKEAFEKEFIIKALKTFRGRINQTALHANIPKKTLLRKIEKYGIVAKDYADVSVQN